MPGHAKISLGSESKGKVLVSVESEPDSSGMKGLGRILTKQSGIFEEVQREWERKPPPSMFSPKHWLCTQNAIKT